MTFAYTRVVINWYMVGILLFSIFIPRKKILMKALARAVIVEEMILLSRLCQIYVTNSRNWHAKSFHSQVLKNSQ